MIIQKLTMRQLWQGTGKFLLMKAGRTYFSANLEVTRRCNLRCDFCDYWRQTGQEDRLKDYSPIVRRLNPLHLTITGGEPLLRADLDEVIRSIREGTSFVYTSLVTNGSLLSVDRARSLQKAGLNQLSVSLDFLDERHDEARGRPGLWRHLSGLLPQLTGSAIDNVCLNTVVMDQNLDDLPAIARTAGEWGCKVSFSTYNSSKSGNRSHAIPPERLGALEEVVEELIAWKRRHHNITSSDFYLRNIVRYFREGGIGGCLAGRKWVQVSPDGTLRRCSEREGLGSIDSVSPATVPATECRECWYACRGESEAPLGLSRIVELNR